jgi:hypothetical protein
MNPSRSRTVRRRIVIGWLPTLLLFALGGTMAGCASPAATPELTYAPPPATGSPASPAIPIAGDPIAGAPTGHTMGHAMPTAAEAEAAWGDRPDFVRSADARTQEAYAFAIARPDVADWMPCYCGCVAMDHRNNTDCYLKPRAEGMPVVFDEHASYCGICVDITLLSKTMIGEGKSLPEIRVVVDAQFGSTAPGTDTPLPAD